MLRPASPLTALLLAAFILLLLSVISTPIVKSIPLGSFEGVDFGVLGFCEGSTCSRFEVGYDTASLFTDDEAATFNLPNSTRATLSAILIVHPIAAFFTLAMLICAATAHMHSPSHSARYLCGIFILSIMTLLLSILAFLIDVLLFVPHMAWGSYMVLAAVILIAISGVVLCAMRRTLVGRKARKKRIEGNAEMSGQNFYARNGTAFPSAKTSSTSDEKPSFTTFSKTETSEEHIPLTNHSPSEVSPNMVSGGNGSPPTSGVSPPRTNHHGNPSMPVRGELYGRGWSAPPDRQFNGNGMGSSERGVTRGRGAFIPHDERGGYGRPAGSGPFRGRGGFGHPAPRGYGGYGLHERGGFWASPGRGNLGPPARGGFGPPLGRDGYGSTPRRHDAMMEGGMGARSIREKSAPPGYRNPIPIVAPYGNRLQDPAYHAYGQPNSALMAPTFAVQPSTQNYVAYQPPAEGTSSIRSDVSSPPPVGLNQPIGQAVEMDATTGSPSHPPSGFGRHPVNHSMGGLEQQRPAFREGHSSVTSHYSTKGLHVPPHNQWDSKGVPSASHGREDSTDDYHEDVDPQFALQDLPPAQAPITNSLTVPPLNISPKRVGQGSSLEIFHPSQNIPLQHPGHWPTFHDPRSPSLGGGDGTCEGARSPAAESDGTEITSISRRGINPQWRERKPNPRPAQQEGDLLLNSNPDFALPAGRGGLGAPGLPRGLTPDGPYPAEHENLIMIASDLSSLVLPSFNPFGLYITSKPQG